MSRNGRPRRSVDPEQVKQLRREGLSWRQIAAQLGLGYGTVYRAAQERSKSDPKIVLRTRQDAMGEALGDGRADEEFHTESGCPRREQMPSH